MNWVGGARKRIRINADKQKQQEFFRKRRLQRELQEIQKAIEQRTNADMQSNYFSQTCRPVQTGNFSNKRHGPRSSQHFETPNQPVDVQSQSKRQIYVSSSTVHKYFPSGTEDFEEAEDPWVYKHGNVPNAYLTQPNPADYYSQPQEDYYSMPNNTSASETASQSSQYSARQSHELPFNFQEEVLRIKAELENDMFERMYNQGTSQSQIQQPGRNVPGGYFPASQPVPQIDLKSKEKIHRRKIKMETPPLRLFPDNSFEAPRPKSRSGSSHSSDSNTSISRKLFHKVVQSGAINQNPQMYSEPTRAPVQMQRKVERPELSQFYREAPPKSFQAPPKSFQSPNETTLLRNLSFHTPKLQKHTNEEPLDLSIAKKVMKTKIPVDLTVMRKPIYTKNPKSNDSAGVQKPNYPEKMETSESAIVQKPEKLTIPDEPPNIEEEDSVTASQETVIFPNDEDENTPTWEDSTGWITKPNTAVNFDIFVPEIELIEGTEIPISEDPSAVIPSPFKDAETQTDIATKDVSTQMSQ